MKIYAKQISPEYQESPLFLGDEFWPEGIILDGNRDYQSRTIPAYDDIKRYFDEMAEEWENDGCYYTYEDGKHILHKCKREYTIAEHLRGYGFQREDGKAWTTKQRHEWRLLMEGEQAADFIEAIKTLASKPENLENLQFYLEQHFPVWMKKFAYDPDCLAAEMKEFANMEI